MEKKSAILDIFLYIPQFVVAFSQSHASFGSQEGGEVISPCYRCLKDHMGCGASTYSTINVVPHSKNVTCSTFIVKWSN